MKRTSQLVCAIAWALLQSAVVSSHAAVSADEAAKLKTTLTPLGGERVGNADGTIPAWTGGYTNAIPGFKEGGRRPDPFADEKPLYSITGQNYQKYESKLNDGQIAMLKKYPDYRIDVYPTHRTASAPQWVYENTLKNATTAKTTNGGYSMQDAYGGIPFPIPQSGTEAMWNELLVWRGQAFQMDIRIYGTSSDGSHFLAGDNLIDTQAPYYKKDGPTPDYNKVYDESRFLSNGPPQHAGEAVLSINPLDQTGLGTQTWQYLPGQRRTRKLPNAAYDTPSAFVSGLNNYDEFYLFYGPMDRYDWKLVGKKEMYVPYNGNRFLQPTKDADVLDPHYLNPSHVRWELHRVWVVEANLRSGQRHVMPKRRFYLDEDTWLALLEDGWDAKGQIWKSFVYLNIVAPDLPGTIPSSFASYDLQTGEYVADNVVNEKRWQIKFVPVRPESFFTPDALTGSGIR